MASRRVVVNPNSPGGSPTTEAHPGTAQRFYLRSTAIDGYRVKRVISTGAMGAVVAARARGSDELVVIKLLHPELRRDPVALLRVAHEARALARLVSEHVVRLVEVGSNEQLGPYLVLEHLEGMDLARMLEAEGPLPLARAVDYVVQACEALSVAHAAGITHRDIKPENLFSVAGGPAPLLKLLDFGISRHAPFSVPDGEADPEDREGPLLGTPAYMAPERILDLPDTDHRADIWSLGVVLHELLTGRGVFHRDDPAETCAQVVNHTRLELVSDRTLLPPPLRAIIARCLARQPAQRFQSVQELAAALKDASTLPERWRGLLTGKFRREMLSEMTALPARMRPVRTALGAASDAVAASPRCRTLLSVGPGTRRRSRLAIAIGIGIALLFGIGSCELAISSIWAP